MTTPLTAFSDKRREWYEVARCALSDSLVLKSWSEYLKEALGEGVLVS